MNFVIELIEDAISRYMLKGQDFLFPMFNYPLDRNLDDFLHQSLKDSKITEIAEDTYDLFVRFEDGAMFKLWNSNRPYAWLSRGKLVSRDRILYKWNNSRPRAHTMLVFERALEDFKMGKKRNKKKDKWWNADPNLFSIFKIALFLGFIGILYRLFS